MLQAFVSLVLLLIIMVRTGANRLYPPEGETFCRHGFHGLLLAAACYGVGLLTADLIQTNFLTSLLLAAGAIVGILFLQWVFFYLLYGYDHSGYALLTRYLPRMVYSFCTMPLCYAFNRALAQQIRSKAE